MPEWPGMADETQKLLDEIAREVLRIYREAADPVAEKFSFERRAAEGEIAGAPTVLFLGNHSSGKSTFINRLLGRELQRTGVAPTDDAFTLISHGDREEDRDGNAIVSNPDLPYEGLRGFGPMFLSHLRLKALPNEFLRNLTLIDSPGMIDAAKQESGRGYDFAGVVRWFAARADVVIVFFDPEKPGTTGETLQVFTESLSGIDHKLLIVMNKIDQFASLRDFARAYGALCWNLGKVIPRKDLPMIFTTYMPVDGAPEPRLPMGDFDKAREELIAEIRRAPARRVDNMITQLGDHAMRLQMHARVCSEARKELFGYALKSWQVLGMLVALFALVGAAAIQLSAPWWVPAAAFALGAGVGYGGWHFIQRAIRKQETTIVAGLPAVFERVYMRDLLVRDRALDLNSQWEVVHPRTRKTVETLKLLSFRRLSAADDARLTRAIQDEIPSLRSKLHRSVGVGGRAAVQAGS
jgi:hypothetical protein